VGKLAFLFLRELRWLAAALLDGLLRQLAIELSVVLLDATRLFKLKIFKLVRHFGPPLACAPCSIHLFSKGLCGRDTNKDRP